MAFLMAGVEEWVEKAVLERLLKQFIDTEWSPERAMARSPSLARALRCFEREANRAPGRTLAE